MAPTRKQTKSVSVLEAAHNAVNARAENYGEKIVNFTNIADMWTVLLRHKLQQDTVVTPQDVAMCMTALKLARLIQTDGRHADSIIDIAGYAECLGQINETTEQ